MRLLALRALGLGDLLTGLPALRALADAFPSHHRILTTTAGVAPLARPPAEARAAASACGPPGGAVAPSNTVPSSLMSTQPTHGLGDAVALTVAASSIARRMAASSCPVAAKVAISVAILVL